LGHWGVEKRDVIATRYGVAIVRRKNSTGGRKMAETLGAWRSKKQGRSILYGRGAIPLEKGKREKKKGGVDNSRGGGTEWRETFLCRNKAKKGGQTKKRMTISPKKTPKNGDNQTKGAATRAKTRPKRPKKSKH